MRLIRYGSHGAERLAAIVGDGPVVDLSERLGDLDDVFALGRGLTPIAELLDADGDELPRIGLDDQRLGSPIPRPHQILCIGLNFADHAAEAGQTPPSEPVVFNKAPNTLVGPYDDVMVPRGSDRLDWEVELGVVIGRRARYLDEPADARQVIAGYTVVNDVSERSFQLDRGGQWVKGKSAETFNPCGPELVSPEEIPDVGDLAMCLRVNGDVFQDGTTASMIFDVDFIVWYLSQFMVLEPGDLINTGTPAGVGMGQRPPRYLQPGDVVELTIDGLGRQQQRIVANA